MLKHHIDSAVSYILLSKHTRKHTNTNYCTVSFTYLVIRHVAIAVCIGVLLAGVLLVVSFISHTPFDWTAPFLLLFITPARTVTVRYFANFGVTELEVEVDNPLQRPHLVVAAQT